MIDLNKAQKAFETYVSHYDQTIPSIRLKITHTYEVMKCTQYLCQQMQLTQEEQDLAMLIALLHDIGRFEQWVRYQSFADYRTIDHALLSSELLFQQGMIREFVIDHQYDNIIKNAIEQHNRYKIEEGFDCQTLLYIHLIRDADKLDNFRVKEEEKIEDILFVSLEEVNQSTISPKVYQQIEQQCLVYSPNRKTPLDMWLSFIAFIFDLHFDESIQYIQQNHWVDRSFDKVQPVNEKTKKEYQILKQRVLDYIVKKG